jgi:hypothetical protein
LVCTRKINCVFPFQSRDIMQPAGRTVNSLLRHCTILHSVESVLVKLLNYTKKLQLCVKMW